MNSQNEETGNLPGIQIDELTVSKLGFTRHLRNSIEGSLTANVGMLKYSPEYLPLSYDSICNLAHFLNIYVSLRLRVQNAVPAQPCVGKLGISLVLLNFLHCNFRLWFKTP